MKTSTLAGRPCGPRSTGGPQVFYVYVRLRGNLLVLAGKETSYFWAQVEGERLAQHPFEVGWFQIKPVVQ